MINRTLIKGVTGMMPKGEGDVKKKQGTEKNH